jgi:hypothetical protein
MDRHMCVCVCVCVCVRARTRVFVRARRMSVITIVYFQKAIQMHYLTI